MPNERHGGHLGPTGQVGIVHHGVTPAKDEGDSGTHGSLGFPFRACVRRGGPGTHTAPGPHSPRFDPPRPLRDQFAPLTRRSYGPARLAGWGRSWNAKKPGGGPGERFAPSDMSRASSGLARARRGCQARSGGESWGGPLEATLPCACGGPWTDHRVRCRKLPLSTIGVEKEGFSPPLGPLA